MVAVSKVIAAANDPGRSRRGFSFAVNTKLVERVIAPAGEVTCLVYSAGEWGDWTAADCEVQRRTQENIRPEPGDSIFARSCVDYFLRTG
jgi:hypothetical protein